MCCLISEGMQRVQINHKINHRNLKHRVKTSPQALPRIMAGKEMGCAEKAPEPAGFPHGEQISGGERKS